MAGVEFLDDSEPFADSLEEAGPTKRRWKLSSRQARLLALIGWFVAAVLVVVAPFQPMVLFRSPQLRVRSITIYDGWGRATAFLLPHGRSGPRFGILLLLCALLLLGMCVLSGLREAGRQARGRAKLRLFEALAIGTPFALFAVVAAMALVVASESSEFSGPRTSTTWGPCMWLALGSLVVCLVASVMFAYGRAREERVA